MSLFSSLFKQKEKAEIDAFRNDFNIRLHLDELDLELLKKHIETTNHSEAKQISHNGYVLEYQFTGESVIISNIQNA